MCSLVSIDGKGVLVLRTATDDYTDQPVVVHSEDP